MGAEKMVVGPRDMFGIIDMQNDFFQKDGALYVAGVGRESSMDRIVAYIKKLITLPFGLVMSSGDQHPVGHIEEKLFGPHCVKDTIGCKIIRELSNEINVAISKWHGKSFLIKGEDSNLISYSVATSKAWTGHIAMMRKLGITRVFLCGLAYTHCVGESAIAYASQGFETYVVRDATRSVAPPYGDAATMDKKLDLYGIKRINISDLK